MGEINSIDETDPDLFGQQFADENLPPKQQLLAIEQLPLDDMDDSLVKTKYTFLNKIGFGGFGVVWKCKEKYLDGDFVAVKCLERDDEGERTYKQETSSLQLLDHRNIILMLDFIQTRSMFYIVLELEHTNLLEFIRRHQKLTENQSRPILKQILLAISYCHGKDILHLDVKPSNVLMSNDCRVKLADFGLSQKFPSTLGELEEVVTLNYRPPELLMGSTVLTKAIDMWSVGCTLAEMCCGKCVFKSAWRISVLFEIFKFMGTPTEGTWPGFQDLPFFKQEFPKFKVAENPRAALQEQTRLLQSLLTPCPDQRITADEALLHPFFAQDT